MIKNWLLIVLADVLMGMAYSGMFIILVNLAIFNPEASPLNITFFVIFFMMGIILCSISLLLPKLVEGYSKRPSKLKMFISMAVFSAGWLAAGLIYIWTSFPL